MSLPPVPAGDRVEIVAREHDAQLLTDTLDGTQVPASRQPLKCRTIAEPPSIAPPTQPTGAAGKREKPPLTT